MHTIPITTDSAASWDWPLQHNDGVVKVTNTSEKFEVGLDAGFFGPNDIDVKVNGIEIIIHLRHDNRPTEYGIVNREVHRTYKLPEDVDPSTVRSHLNSSGVLTITANKL
ncbi:SHSP domain-containing protein [Caenorhabditis elegans]|uniref:SHSP domain-containing protein n=1 Tax=Caenorhabditis elegans TaxID=6239 RepID=O01263_CAEEL|nr:SHSP domain-containing protein [Caenorhabditis elegans]CAB03380.1 SHSP domain-containing protein [Caenorhabditis elegans]|eukprot:NP_001076613.1 Heat Shock Protein [Caenorhabditis elegans]